MKHMKLVRIAAVLCAASLLLVLGACSPAETFKGWFGARWTDERPYESYKDLEKYVKLGTYKGVEAAFVGQDEYLELYMNDFFAQYQAPMGIEVDPAKTTVATGDLAYFSFEGTAEGASEKDLAGMKGKALLVIGSGNFIPGFEDQMVGKALNKEFTVKVTFPDPYGQDAEGNKSALSGKEATFKCTVFSLGAPSGKATDEGVIALTGGEYTTVKALQDMLLKDIGAQLPEMVAGYNKNIAFDAVYKSAEIIELPKKELDYWDEHITLLASSQGAESPEEYAQQNGFESPEAFRDEKVRLEVVTHAIAQKEGLAITDADVQKMLGEIRTQGFTGTDGEIYSQFGGKGYLMRLLMQDIVMNFVYENAKDVPVINAPPATSVPPANGAGDAAQATEPATESATTTG